MSRKLDWELRNRQHNQRISMKDYKKTIRRMSKKSVHQDKAERKELRDLKAFLIEQNRLVDPRGGPRVGAITAIYSAKGTRIPLPSKAAKFILWRDEGS